MGCHASSATTQHSGKRKNELKKGKFLASNALHSYRTNMQESQTTKEEKEETEIEPQEQTTKQQTIQPIFGKTISTLNFAQILTYLDIVFIHFRI